MSIAAASTTPARIALKKQPARLSDGPILAVYLLVCLSFAGVWLAWQTQPDNPRDARDLATPLWTMAVGIATNASCAILGCYLVLRRMSLLGDAISHAVLPGIVLGYYYSTSVAGWPIFLGAVAAGMLTAALTQGIASLGRVSEDTSMGVVFSSLFAIGVVLINTLDMSNAHIDADCVLYGDYDLVSTDLVDVLGWPVPRTLLVLLPALAATLLFVAVLWKELKIVAFDPALAAAMGFRVAIVHYLLMGMVAAVSVASFEAVGSILVVAMLIVPAAAAAQMTDRLRWMLAWAVAIGATSAIFGYLASMVTNGNAAGMMAVVAGLQFGLAVLLSPKQGLVTRWLRNLSLAVRIAAEDVIGQLYRAEEGRGGAQRTGDRGQGTRGQGTGQASGGRSESPLSLRGRGAGGEGAEPSVRRQPPQAIQTALVRWLARLRLYRAGWIERDRNANLQLTAAGRSAARNLVRAHRLWETYLDTHFDLPRDHLHDAAERMEHFLDPELQEELAAEFAGRALDPQGKEIPPADAASR
jgi:ABC-type Mn2+/Zn2+ transport system permease subunit